MFRRTRRRLHQFNDIDHAARLLKDSKNVVVLTGAGISTSVGIPDFRSEKGLYKQITSARRFQDPQQLFETDTFYQWPMDFWKDVRPIIPKLATFLASAGDGSSTSLIETVPKFGDIHGFLNVLQSRGKLLMNFTQNIDGLELAAGVEEDKTVKCHGSWDTATCITCKGKVDANDYLPVVHAGELPLCACSKPPDLDPTSDLKGMNEMQRATRPKKAKADADVRVQYLEPKRPKAAPSPVKATSKPKTKKRKRDDLDDDLDESDKNDPVGRPGLLKPDIVFFDEAISRAYRPTLEKIKSTVDLLIIIGTSLPVEPVNELPFDIPAHVPQIWISKERCKREGLAVDIELIGDCNLVVEELCRRTDWTTLLMNRIWVNRLGSRHQAKLKMRLKAMEHAAKASPKPKEEQSESPSLRQAPPAEAKPVAGKEEKKAKPAVESKVQVEQMMGFHHIWLVKARQG